MKEKEIRKLLLQYNRVLNKLYDGGVIRTSKLVSEYGEYVVCKKLGLERTKSTVAIGYDAVDKWGKKYEIKARKENEQNRPTLFPISDIQLKKSDYIVYVGFATDWTLEKLLKIPTKILKPYKNMRIGLTKELEKYDILKRSR